LRNCQRFSRLRQITLGIDGIEDQKKIEIDFLQNGLPFAQDVVSVNFMARVNTDVFSNDVFFHVLFVS